MRTFIQPEGEPDSSVEWPSEREVTMRRLLVLVPLLLLVVAVACGGVGTDLPSNATLSGPDGGAPGPTSSSHESTGKVKVPNLRGKTKSGAIDALKSAVLKARSKTKTSTKADPGHVFSQSIAAGKKVDPRTVVTFTVAKAPSGGDGGGGGGGGRSNCTPGYSPCLLNHNYTDYDCAGGSGNGPYYTEPGVTYRVTGSDPYGLDADNDGYGCE
jgi:hypothetical protein